MKTEENVSFSPRDALQRVLRSGTFRNAEAQRNLLTYLVEKSLAGPSEDLKEYTIAIEACGKPPSYDPQRDASVRVQVSRLRQRLEEYYRTEGAADSLVLELPKGRFSVLFKPARVAEPLPGSLWARFRKRLLRLRPGTGHIVLLLLLAVVVAFAFVLWRQVRDYERRFAISRQAEAVSIFAPLWGPFLSHTVPSSIVFGSPPFFASLEHRMFVRLYSQTDPEDPRSSPEFASIQSKIGPLDGPRFDYASMGDAVAIQRLTAFFGSAGVSLSALPAHLAAWETIRDGNLIFIGASRMHPLLRRLPVAPDFEPGDGDRLINRNPQAGEQPVYTTPDHRNVMTYAVVALYPGLNPGREIMVITAHSSPGAMGAVDYITRPASAKLLVDRIGLTSRGPRCYFQLLLRIYVDKDAPVKTEYVTHHIKP